MSSSNLSDALLEDPDRSVKACLMDFQIIIIKKVEDILKKKFDSLMRVFNGQKSFDSTKYDELKEKFIADTMPLLTPKYSTLLKDPELETRILDAIPKREYNYSSEDANVVAKMLKPCKKDALESLKGIKSQVETLKKAEEQILVSFQSEIGEVVEKQKFIKKKTLESIVPMSTVSYHNCQKTTLKDF
uniref:Uncharacterized protein n=1 Tax=Tetranychus urticae TaxID=32264 RepID=T1K2D5_TETUR